MEQRPLPEEVRIVEVGPRDGFQMEERFIPTDLKVEAIERLAASGVGEVEVTSFVRASVIPQLSDASEVMRRLHRRSGVLYSALVPNLRGAELALEAGVDGVHVVVCASETYNRKNVGLSVEESLAAVAEIVERVESPRRVAVTLAATFGCPFEGQLPDGRIVELADRLRQLDIAELGLADSVGLGDPRLVRRLVRKVRRAVGELPLRMHLHDTRGLGLANSLVALEEGVASFDTAFGGLGGCPIVLGASGNVATEDFVNLCSEMGVETGVSLQRVREVSRLLEAFLGRPLPSRVLQAGTRQELYERNRDVVEGAG